MSKRCPVRHELVRALCALPLTVWWRAQQELERSLGFTLDGLYVIYILQSGWNACVSGSEGRMQARCMDDEPGVFLFSV